MRVDLFHHGLFGQDQPTDDTILLALKEMETRMSAKMDRAVQLAEANNSAVDSLIGIVNSLKDRLVEAREDPAKIDEIIADLEGQQARIAAAVLANTPAVEVGTAEPAPVPEVPTDVSTATPEEVAEGAPPAGDPLPPAEEPSPNA